MKTIKLGNSISFNVIALVDRYGCLEIEFDSSVTYSQVSPVYDPVSPSYSKDVLRRMEIYDEQGELQGTHLGYTETIDISSLNGTVKVKIEKENELKTDVEVLKLQNQELQKQNDTLNGAVSELTMIVAMGGM